MTRPPTSMWRVVVVVAVWLAAVGLGWALVALASGAGGSLLTGGSWLVAFGCIAIDVTIYATVGAFLVVRRAGGRIGPVLMAGAVLVGVTFVGFVVGASPTQARGPEDPLAGWASLVGGVTIYPAIILAGPALAILVPDGRLPGPRWRWAVGIVVTMYVVGIALMLGRPGPLGDSLGTNPVGDIGIPFDATLAGIGDSLAAATLPISLLLAVVAVIVRYRRSAGVERQQLKWFVAANILFAVCMAASIADGATEPTVFDLAAFIVLSFPAIAIGIAVTRYRLYDLDRIISRTLGWAIVTGLLVAMFAAGVVGLQAVLSGVTQGQTLAVAGSTLVAFALFQPLRRRVQRAVDRRFDRARYDGERMAQAFAERLRDETDMAAVAADLTGTTRSALAPTTLGIWLREAGR